MLAAVIVSALFNAGFAQQAEVANTEPHYKQGKTLNHISIRAIRDFHSMFGDTFDEDWYKVGNGYIAKFTENNMKVRVDFDRNGNWLSTVKIMTEKQMPRQVRNKVKSIYFDYTITLVMEIENKEDKIYVVNLEGETTWKKVKVSDGEMIELEDYNKAP